jgi:flagellar motor switch protein FliM
MEKVLNQGEIDAMVRAARSGRASNAVRVAQPVVQPWDIRQAGQIGREQLTAINQLHDMRRFQARKFRSHDRCPASQNLFGELERPLEQRHGQRQRDKREAR